MKTVVFGTLGKHLVVIVTPRAGLFSLILKSFQQDEIRKEEMKCREDRAVHQLLELNHHTQLPLR